MGLPSCATACLSQLCRVHSVHKREEDTFHVSIQEKSPPRNFLLILETNLISHLKYTMKSAAILFVAVIAGSLDVISAFITSRPQLYTVSSSDSYTPRYRSYNDSKLFAGGWGNNQERSVSNEEFGGVNGSPIYDSYAIEDRGEFMQRVNEERKSLRIKKAADLLEVARIAGVELKKKERDPEKLDLFDPEDISSDDEYLDVSI